MIDHWALNSCPSPFLQTSMYYCNTYIYIIVIIITLLLFIIIIIYYYILLYIIIYTCIHLSFVKAKISRFPLQKDDLWRASSVRWICSPRFKYHAPWSCADLSLLNLWCAHVTMRMQASCTWSKWFGSCSWLNTMRLPMFVSTSMYHINYFC
jgi:hypothetical protein